MATKFATKKTPAKKTTAKKEGNGLPMLKYPGDIGYDSVNAQDVTPGTFESTDTTFNYDDIFSEDVTAEDVTAGSVKAGRLADRFMTAADYTIVDPSEIATEYGDLTRSEMRKNSALSSDLALDALNTELKGLQNFVPAASNLKRSEIAKDNSFNQEQRDATLAAGDPSLRGDLMSQRERATAYAEGRVPDSVQDRALELGIRSRAADAASSGGFGVRSSAARKASELMSAEQRIQLSQYGDQSLTQNINSRSQLLLAPTEYSDAGGQVQVQPSQSGAQVALQIASEANAGMITAKDALSSTTQQQQFKTGLEQDTRKTNVQLEASRDLNQANLDLQADTSNVDRQLAADTGNADRNLNAATTNESNRLRASEVNAANAIDTQKTAMTISSNEKQFVTQQNNAIATSNADRQFQAANANAGRSLEVASSNRATKLDVQKTNKAMIFQDQQARKAEAAANSRAAAAASASRANAALSYKSQQEAIAANTALQREQMAFQLEQQRMATDAYKEGISRGNASQDAGTAGQLISRAPSVIAGVGTLVDGVGKIYDMYNEWDTSDTSMDDMELNPNVELESQGELHL